MAANGATARRRSSSDYSEVQASRLRTSLSLPDVLRNSFKVVDGPPSSATGNPGGKWGFKNLDLSVWFICWYRYT
ncbi:UNVERIFIED_CONTAM: Pyrophosphate--fructose 6-phosphate 1-phosphotransferase subunit beta [Sesamum angustifolium]|uniref:Pyrophosphate--fructose 6-phosphate 1-phosphotransferase subunit beta n=1 Tax=Sesamum angustifolium TaxID=2727405 RepID=A0AAW2MUP1_9LAMI